MKLLTGACLVSVPVAADAYIPAVPIPEFGWNGPGHLCEAHFSLKVESSEFVLEDPQLELWYPESYTVKSSDGWYSLVVLRKKTERRKRTAKISASKLVTIYGLQPADDSSVDFLIIPRDRAKPSLLIEFFVVDKPNPFSSNWRVTPQKSYDSDRYQTVLDRIDFSGMQEGDCFEH